MVIITLILCTVINLSLDTKNLGFFIAMML
ncbi:hypothetical protein [Shigella phage ESh30]|nr:hypothetical protein [Shigella phage ESh30]